MEPGFWLQRWQEGRTGFHRDKVMPLLERHWPALGVPPGSRVFVPLAGKSLDMIWLAAQGYRVLGVELSPLGIRQFLDENGLRAEVHESRLGRHHVAGDIELVEGDVFGFDGEVLADCRGVYDRAALIALPPELRRRYADGPYASLPRDCRGLLITLEYPPEEKDGPPFPIDAAEVERLFTPSWRSELLERRDILADEPGFRAEGVTALSTAVWALARL
ncbi:MAG: thiopurine S-methyltransferase [Xanthomonadales bacterium]|nr:thiopurine S-methyltransferase [Xanthomonadales bacterium]